MNTYGSRLMQALVLTACIFVVAKARGESPEAIRKGIEANLQANFHACNQEDLSALLATMSVEMPQRELFIETVQQEWAAEDTYNRLVDVQVLKHSDAPHANTRFPYATVLVTQETLRSTPENKQAFQDCREGDCRNEDLAHLFAISPKSGSKVRYQTLFKKERGKWKGVANLTEPEPVDEEEPATPKPSRQGSAFN
jgi:hypothetical protein